MSVTVLDYGHGGGGLGTAISAWDQFFGMGSRLRQQQLAGEKASSANTQAALPGIQANSTSAQLNAQLAQQGQNALGDAMNLDMGKVNSGLGPDHQITDKNAPFWYDLEPEERQHLLNQFPSVDPKYKNIIPDAYNGWVTQTYHKLPAMMMPQGLSTSGFGMVGMRPNDKGQLEPQFGPITGPWSGAQEADIRQGPETVAQSKNFSMFERDKAYPQSQDFAKVRSDYSDRVLKTPNLAHYFGDGGQQEGILPLWQDVDSFRAQHTDPKTGAWTSDLSPQESMTLVFRLGRIDNPGAIVRDSTFEQLAKNAGVYDTVVANLSHWAEGKSKVPAAVAHDIYNVVDQLKGSAEQRAYDSMISWEPELAQRGLKLDDVIKNAPSLQRFNQIYGPMMPDIGTAKAKLPPGALFHLPGGQRAQIDPAAPASPTAPTPSAAPGMPPLSVGPQVSPPAAPSGVQAPSAPGELPPIGGQPPARLNLSSLQASTQVQDREEDFKNQLTELDRQTAALNAAKGKIDSARLGHTLAQIQQQRAAIEAQLSKLSRRGYQPPANGTLIVPPIFQNMPAFLQPPQVPGQR